MFFVKPRSLTVVFKRYSTRTFLFNSVTASDENIKTELQLGDNFSSTNKGIFKQHVFLITRIFLFDR